MPIADTAIINADPDVVSAGLGPGMVLLNLSRKIYYSLDEVGVVICKAVTDGAGLHEICEAIEAEFDVDHARCRSDAEAIVLEMEDARLFRIERLFADA